MIQFQQAPQANDPRDLQQLLLSNAKAKETEERRQKALAVEEEKTLKLRDKHREAAASAGRAVGVYSSLAVILLGSTGVISLIDSSINPFMLLGVGALSFAIGGLGGGKEWLERSDEKKKLQAAEKRLAAVAKAKRA